MSNETEIMKNLAAKFTSHNSVEVERATILRSEYDELALHFGVLEAEVQEDNEFRAMCIEELTKSGSPVFSVIDGISALTTERDKLKAENERLRKKSDLLESHASIRYCKKCRGPVIQGNCCIFCGDTNPSEC